MMTDTLKNRVIKTTKGEIFPDVDGYYYWFVNNKGSLGAAELRIIANRLDELNKEWDEKINKDIGGAEHGGDYLDDT